MAKQPRSPSKVHCMLMPRSALQVPGLGLGSAARKVPNVVHAVGTGTNLGPWIRGCRYLLVYTYFCRFTVVSIGTMQERCKKIRENIGIIIKINKNKKQETRERDTGAARLHFTSSPPRLPRTGSDPKYPRMNKKIKNKKHQHMTNRFTSVQPTTCDVRER